MEELVGKILYESPEFQAELEREKVWARIAGAEKAKKLVIEKLALGK